jgi:hypothetical protein
LNYLSAARQFVADGERELASQREAVRRIEQDGEDPLQAILILGEIEEMQQVYVDHRDRLEQQVLDLIRPLDWSVGTAYLLRRPIPEEPAQGPAVIPASVTPETNSGVHVFEPSHFEPGHPALQMISKAKKRGGLAPLMGFRPAPTLRAAIVKWAEYQPDTPTLSQALARLVELGLSVGEDEHRVGGQPQRRARKMAADTIDGMGDATANAGDRASRKRCLLNGPKEFTRVRVDRSKWAF